MNAKALVIPRRPGLCQQFLEAFFAFGGQLVDVLARRLLNVGAPESAGPTSRMRLAEEAV